jgi:eukaryotic-like serine/threonine-protein kinase
MTTRIKLNREWTLGERIGGGGFGEVYAATSNGDRAVIKLVPKAPGAGRELLFVDVKGVRNAVPVIDSGEYKHSWALVMPRADTSLREYLTDLAEPLEMSKAITILADIATALSDIDSRIVHRDLKPENVLLLGGAWCLADFGISRYAEASTAPDTQKFALSPPYAAPERWRNERATSATDIYSLGVIAFELLTGKRLFGGPAIEDYREQHLHREAPEIASAPAALRAMIAECLYKAPGARPTAANVLARLQRVGREQPLSGAAKLRGAYLAEVGRRSESERKKSEDRSRAEQRAELFRSAERSLKTIQDELFAAIKEAAPAAQETRGKNRGRTLALGSAQIEFFNAMQTGENPWEWEAPSFDVVAHSGLIVRIPRDRYGYEGRSHALWFCDAQVVGRYQWYELAFMITPMISKTTTIRPFMLEPGIDAAKALWVGVAETQLAWPVSPVTVGELDEFIDRAMGWFADAADGRLQIPSTMPERPTPRTGDRSRIRLVHKKLKKNDMSGWNGSDDGRRRLRLSTTLKVRPRSSGP